MPLRQFWFSSGKPTGYGNFVIELLLWRYFDLPKYLTKMSNGDLNWIANFIWGIADDGCGIFMCAVSIVT
jgi:hypothetical protein